MAAVAVDSKIAAVAAVQTLVVELIPVEEFLQQLLRIQFGTLNLQALLAPQVLAVEEVVTPIQIRIKTQL
jgi:hypothetical protein